MNPRSDISSDPAAIDWIELRAAAVEAAACAHAPYSGLRVGAAGLTDDGRILTGCNVESASFGLTLCAECGVISSLHRSGGGKLTAVVALSANGRILTPCGRCRQLLHENGHPTLLVDHVPAPVPITALLPDAFDADDLPSEAES